MLAFAGLLLRVRTIRVVEGALAQEEAVRFRQFSDVKASSPVGRQAKVALPSIRRVLAILTVARRMTPHLHVVLCCFGVGFAMAQ